jgi:hypothetical protein
LGPGVNSQTGDLILFDKMYKNDISDEFKKSRIHQVFGFSYFVFYLTYLTCMLFCQLFILLNTKHPIQKPKHSRKRSPEDTMIPGFTKIVEERIRRAQKKGEFENLEGTGKPLNLADDQAVAEELRLAYKILKNADCLPPEIEVKKEIQQTEALLAGMTDTAEKYRTLKKLNFLIMKLNTLRSTSIKFEEPQKYSDKLIKKLESSASRVKKKK